VRFAASKAGVVPKTIERWEKGGNARHDELLQLADAYGVNVETLWADYQPPVPESDGRDNLRQEQLNGEESEKTRAAAHHVMLDWYKERYEALAKELGATQLALASSFKILEAQHVPLGDRNAPLHEIATSHKQFQQDSQNKTACIDPQEKTRHAGLVPWSPSRRCNFVWEESFWTSALSNFD
jgi:hypothetical protein